MKILCFEIIGSTHFRARYISNDSTTPETSADIISTLISTYSGLLNIVVREILKSIQKDVLKTIDEVFAAIPRNLKAEARAREVVWRV